MAKIFGVNTKISGKVGQLLYRQTRTGTVVSELPVKPVIPRRSARQMDRRAQWANLGAIYKQFDAMLRKGYENLPPQMSVYNAFIQANIDVVKVYITKTIRLNGGAILAPYQITRGSLPSIGMAKNASNILVSSVALGTLAIDANTTVGQFSQAVIDNNDSFLEGDQLTFFHGRQTIDSVTRTPRATIKGYKVVLDTAADAKLWDVVDVHVTSTGQTGIGNLYVPAVCDSILYSDTILQQLVSYLALRRISSECRGYLVHKFIIASRIFNEYVKMNNYGR